MDIIKRIAQFLWNISLYLVQSFRKLFSWWVAKIRNSNSRKGSVAWLVGGLVGICFACSVLFSFTPAGREAAENSRATSTAVAIAEATNEKATQNAPTNTPLPTLTNEPTPTDTVEAVVESRTETIEISPSTATPASVDGLESTTVPLIATVSVQVARANVRSGPGTEYLVVEVLEQEDSLIATGFNTNRGWIQIELSNGEKGWIGTELVEIENAETLSEITDIPPTPIQTVAVQQPPATGGNSGNSGGNSENPFQCEGGCATAPDPSCAIKGNVNSSGERIYHVPGGSFYNRTDIKPEEGDRWFCTEAEAQAAGFRRSER